MAVYAARHACLFAAPNMRTCTKMGCGVFILPGHSGFRARQPFICFASHTMHCVSSALLHIHKPSSPCTVASTRHACMQLQTVRSPLEPHVAPNTARPHACDHNACKPCPFLAALRNPQIPLTYAMVSKAALWPCVSAQCSSGVAGPWEVDPASYLPDWSQAAPYGPLW